MEQALFFKITFSDYGTMDDDHSFLDEWIVNSCPDVTSWGYVRHGKVGIARIYGIDRIPTVVELGEGLSIVSIVPSSQEEFTDLT